jgi:cell division GTPase FtsZ
LEPTITGAFRSTSAQVCSGAGAEARSGRQVPDGGDIIHIPGPVNVDFEDVKTVMSEPGKAMMGIALAGGPDRATKAADLAVACPLLEGIDLSGARRPRRGRVLVLIAASKQTFKLAESPSMKVGR